MGPPKSTERLKARLLRDAVEDNLDAIHNRAPQSLRPWRRLTRLWLQSAWRVAFPVSVIVALLAVARWPAAAPSEPPRSSVPAAARVAPGARVASIGAPDALRPSQPIHSGVLDLTVRRVVIDAGHGGDNLGASSVGGGLREKALTLDIAERVRQLTTARGFEAFMTRSTDETLSLEQRASSANGHRGDIFVSIHLNSLPSKVCGIETYYLGPSSSPELDPLAAVENQHSGYSLSDLRALLEKLYMDARRDESRRLATSVQRALLRTMRKAEPALTDRGVKTAPFVVLLATEMPAILAEVSCLSNPDEAERLKTPEYRQTIAGALVSGIQNFADE